MVLLAGIPSKNHIVAAINRLHDEGGTSADFFNVKDYGALGDGSNDDTAEIQAALDAASSVGATTVPSTGGIVFFPGGEYKVTSTLTVAGGTHIMGAGIYATHVFSNGLTGILFDCNGIGITFSNLIIDHSNEYNGTGSSGVAIDFTTATTVNPSWFHLTNIWVTADGVCLNLGHASGSQAGDGWVSNCAFFRGTNGVGVAIDNWRQVEFHGVFLFNTGVTTENYLTIDSDSSRISWIGGQTNGGTTSIASSTTRVIGANLGGDLTLEAASDACIVALTTGGNTITDSGAGNDVTVGNL